VNCDGGGRPAYKEHPLWSLAMALTRDAYALAEAIRPRDAESADRLRKAAVSVPAHVATALAADGDKSAEEVRAARGALGEVARLAGRDGSPEAVRLERQATLLDRRVLFDFSAGEGSFS
jgi:hypothetical protein